MCRIKIKCGRRVTIFRLLYLVCYAAMRWRNELNERRKTVDGACSFEWAVCSAVHFVHCSCSELLLLHIALRPICRFCHFCQVCVCVDVHFICRWLCATTAAAHKNRNRLISTENVHIFVGNAARHSNKKDDRTRYETEKESDPSKWSNRMKCMPPSRHYTDSTNEF